MYRVGDIHRAELHGLAGHWTVHGTVTIWKAAGRYLLLQLSDHPDPAVEPAHTTYASGLTTPGAHGHVVIDRPVTPRPGPARIVIGSVIGHRHPAPAAQRVEDAHTQLAPHHTPGGTTLPLGEGFLPHLDVEVAHAAELADQLSAATTRVNNLVARLFDGGRVKPAVLAAHIGKDRSIVYQIRNRVTATRGDAASVS